MTDQQKKDAIRYINGFIKSGEFTKKELENLIAELKKAKTKS